MTKLIKHKPVIFCCIVFLICLCIRFFEYFIIKTDETIISENIIHKAFGIVFLAVLLKISELKWSDIGLCKNSVFSGLLYGILLGLVCFAVSFTVEIIILHLQNNSAHLELYISGFSITGSQIKNTGINFFVLCIIFNIINVLMEEGIFRGLFIKTMSGKYSFINANLITALLFGIWHFVMPIRSFIYGEMTLSSMLFMALGYIILSGLMSIKWGLLYQMSGNLWIGIGDHFFNNAVATNMLHVVSASGADALQIIRIMLAQLISFTLVVILYLKKSPRNHPPTSSID